MRHIIKKFPILIFYLLRINIFLALLVFLLQKNWLSAASALSILLILSAPFYLKRRYQFYIPFEFEIVALIFIYLSVILGDWQKLYDKIWWWDIYLHLTSGILLGLLGFFILYLLNQNKGFKIKLRAGFVALFSLTFAVTTGVLWEFFEYGTDYFFHTNMQRSGLADTMWDLIMDFVGAFIISSVGYLWMKERLSFYFFDSTLKKFIKKNQHFFE